MQDARELAGPYKGTFEVKTTMVPQLQALAEKVVAEALDREGAEAGASQAALVAMTPPRVQSSPWSAGATMRKVRSTEPQQPCASPARPSNCSSTMRH